MLVLPMRQPLDDSLKNIKATWVALTGGPCSGKSTSLSLAQRELTDRGFRVLVIDEAATRTITGGVTSDLYGNYAMQRFIALQQVANELIVQDLMENGDYDQYVIICDRGLLDGAAYMGMTDFDKMLQDSFGVTAAEARDSYQLVIHMVTAADGALEYYNLDNQARKETPEQARQVDQKTQKAWMGHPNYHLVDNVGVTFEQKQQRVLDTLFEYLGQPIPIQKYKKYLVNLPDIAVLEEQKAYTKVDILRYYLPDRQDKIERSVTQRRTHGECTYYYSERRHLEDKDRIYVERRIPDKAFHNYVGEAFGPVRKLEKERHCFSYDNKYYELDVVPGLGKYAILKIQLTKEEKHFEIPHFLNAVMDVTNNASFTNKELASVVTP